MEGNPLDPNSSPLRVSGPGVRRLNKWPLLIAGSLVGIVILLVILAGQQRQIQVADFNNSHGSGPSSLGQEFAGNTGYVAPPAATPKPTPWPTPIPTPDDTELRMRQAAFYKSLEAGTAVSDPLVDQMNQKPIVAPDKGKPVNPILEPARTAAVLFPTPTPRPWVSDMRVERAASPFILQTGWVIRATLISGMESQLRGSVIAQVSQNVYDSPTGQYLLIPQGARLFGEYGEIGVLFGQNRLAVVWQRIMFPDGSTLDINDSEGADAIGESGFHDLVDRHLLEIFSAAALLSVVNAGIAATQQPYGGYGHGDYNNQNGYSQQMGAAFAQQMGSATMSILQKFIDQPPTIKIRQGYNFLIISRKDLVFPMPYIVGNFDKVDP